MKSRVDRSSRSLVAGVESSRWIGQKSSQSIESIDRVDRWLLESSRVESMDWSKVESIYRVDREWMLIDRTGRLDRFRGLKLDDGQAYFPNRECVDL